MLIRGHKINKYKYKLKYLHISAGIKKLMTLTIFTV